MQGLDNVIAQAGQVVSSMVSYPAYAVASGKSAVTIRRYDLLPVDGGSFIAVVMTDDSRVKSQIIRCGLPVDGGSSRPWPTCSTPTSPASAPRRWGRS